jgi:hypothetical protein
MLAVTRFYSPLLSLVMVMGYMSGLAAQCSAPVVTSTATDDWSNKIVGALVGAEACYADKSAFTNTDCNIFVGRVLEQAYGLSDLVLQQPENGIRYKISDEIATYLAVEGANDWETIGPMNDVNALRRAKDRADQGKAVIAVWSNPHGPGHVALVGPGPLTHSPSLNLNVPVSASFFQGHPEKNYIAKPLSCAFLAGQVAEVRLYARK